MAFDTIDPATGRVLETFEYMNVAQVDRLLDAAVRAQRAWRETSSAERAEFFERLARGLRTESGVLAATAVREMGKPHAQAVAEVEKCAVACEHFAQNAAKLLADVPLPSSGSRSYAAIRPLGIVLAIMPWNYPYWQYFRAAIPALLAGNGVVLKHAENTTRCALEIERIVAAAGGPEGMAPTLLVENPEIDRRIADARIAGVTLTGSERAGVAVASAAGAALKKSVLELGGSDAFVVLRDADIDAAAQTAVTARFQNNGQSCIAAKRFIVEDAAYDAFLDRFIELARALRVGDPAEPDTVVGPCAREDLRATLDAQVRATVDAGARLELGGKALARDGYFYEPTIVSNVQPGSRMFEEEVFGPAAAVVRARDERHAIELANASSYGLGCSIWSSDVARAESLAARVESGMVFVNAMVASDPRLPFGGLKKSGYGRELSAMGVREFANVQTVYVAAAKKQALMEATLFGDGGSRGNPGPAASGAVLLSKSGAVLREVGTYLGRATNNVAEWTALVTGLEAALEMDVKRLAVRMDSELVVKQITGVYRVKHPDLQPLARRAAALLRKFESVDIRHVPRKENTLADGLVNQVLDAHADEGR